MTPKRDERFHIVSPPPDAPPSNDIRSLARRDRDRILYTSAFRRLADVTQVVSPSEGQVFHNRLTHTLKVAQIGRSIAESLIERFPARLRDTLTDLDPDVVEAAALAHDLGHPPFGHVAEKVLNDLLKDTKYSVSDGFEGNAQSFRIVTRTAVHHRLYDGLNLTRATLNAILKYPCLRGPDGPAHGKWGAYRTEEPVFRWARAGVDDGQTLEAQIMDWADDVAYSVHDAEDFYRAGWIPLDRLAVLNSDENKEFKRKAIDNIKKRGWMKDYSEQELIEVFDAAADTIPNLQPYSGKKDQRARLRGWTSNLISSYISDVGLQVGVPGKRGLIVNRQQRMEVLMLKQLIWVYVIDNPDLVAQQVAQAQVIRNLFKTYISAAGDADRRPMFPHGYREKLEGADPQERTRVVVDFITSMTEQQALAQYQRLCGISLDPVLQPRMM